VTEFDLVVLGGGPGGYAAALYGASAGLDIAMVEQRRVGGTCLHCGCIPAKELLQTAEVYRTVGNAAEFGVETSAPALDMSVTQVRKQQVIDRLTSGLESLLKGRKVTVVNGTGTLAPDGHTVVVSDGTELRGTNVLIATGSSPRALPLPGFEFDEKVVLSSDHVLELEQVPSRVAVIGGGAIGCEFASMMSDLGTQVTILEALPKILPGCDQDVADLVVRSFKKRGIAIHTGVQVTGHTPKDDGSATVVHVGGGQGGGQGEGQDLEVELVVMSVGRRPFPDLLDLDGSGVEVDQRGYVKVDERCRTTASGVWAVGDLVATPQLAHVGFAEGITVIRDILGEDPVPVDYDRVPWAIYCHPEVAFAGYSEEQATEKGFDVVTSKHRYVGNGRAMIIGDTEGLVKVIAEKRPDGTGGRVLGVHMVGPWVTEQLGQGYLAVNWEANVDEVAQFIQPHPTMSELFGESMLALTGRSLH
jgi:dihydrolipoamide dehydrogenase